MPKRSKINALPKEVRDWLNATLGENGGADLVLLSEALKAQGYDISKSAVGRHSQQIQRRLSAIKASTEAAKLISEQAKDDGNALSGSVLSMLNSEFFEILVSLQDLEGLGEDKKIDRALILAKIAKATAEVSRAGTSQKKYATEVQSKLDAIDKTAADASKNMTPEEAYKAAIEAARRAYGVN